MQGGSANIDGGSYLGDFPSLAIDKYRYGWNYLGEFTQFWLATPHSVGALPTLLQRSRHPKADFVEAVGGLQREAYGRADFISGAVR